MQIHELLFLSDQFRHIESLMEFRDRINVNVSKVSVAWHLDHLLKVINGIYAALKQSDPKKYSSDFNISRSTIFILGKFPRGRGQSPQSVLPPENILIEDLLEQLEQSKKNVLTIDTLDKNQYFRHAVFGTLNRDKAKRFIEIHTNHHLRIIRDILNH